MYRVLHAPVDIAGQAGLMCEFLRAVGWHAVAYNYFPSYLKYRNGVVETDAYQLQRMFEYAIDAFDVFHYHNGLTFFADKRDLAALKAAGNKIVMHHRGNDVRFSAKAAKGPGYANPYAYTGNSLPDDVIDANLRLFARHADAVIVQDYELYGYVKEYYEPAGVRVHVLPRLIDTRRTPVRYPSAAKRIPLVVHAPTDRDFKGSDAVIESMRSLRKRMRFDFALLERLPHAEAMRRYLEADVVIDQIRCGAYGNVSVEAMAMGKPVVTYIREDLRGKYPGDLPVVSAHPDSLEEAVGELLERPERRQALGRMGRRYAETHHDARTVIRRLTDIYASL